jgi:uncharacterized repeat protein (TIGR03806 family)
MLLARAAAAGPPFGLERRIPWTSSRLVGSPEPPLPYTVAKTFTHLEWKSPIYIAPEPGTDRLLVVLAGGEPERPSRVLRLKDDPAAAEAETFLEIERRLIYSVAFHPAYGQNGFLFVFTNGETGKDERANRVSRFVVERQPPWRVQPGSEEAIIEWRSAGHDGGDLAFGRDGMLFLTTGDGTSDSDGWNSGQTLDDLLGSVLRIDVDRREGERRYAIPPDNPFLSTPGARPEIWAYGLRNPWRMSFDPASGQLWVGNNGQDLWETAHLVRRGDNYGWSVFEGNHPFYLNRKLGPTPHVPPTIEHPHAEFRSLTGGVVTRGGRFPELEGAYIYGDYSSGRIWGMKHDGERVEWHRELADTALQIAAFAVDQRGELLIVDHGGGLYHLVPTARERTLAPFPGRLSETGLYVSVKDHRVEPGVIPYAVQVAGWADGAVAQRFMAVPGEARVEYDSGGSWRFPDGTALVQTLALEREDGNPASRLRVETRVLVRQDGEWAGYSYRWNEEETDAWLVPREGAEAEFTLRESPGGEERRQRWRFPGRTECMACHSRAANFVLGITGAQLNREHDYGEVRDQQLRALEHIDFFTGKLPELKDVPRLPDLDDGSQDLEARARAYLHVNCSVCHVEAGGGNAKMELRLSTARERTGLLGARPQHDAFGIPNAMLVAPGDPRSSVLLHRLSRRGPGQMPPIASHRADEGAVRLFRDWIAQLKPEKAMVKDWQMGDLLPALDGALGGRLFASGQAAFRESGCVQCHHFAGEGGTVGPSLTGVARRQTARDLLESILLPSKVIADEYSTFLVETEDGELLCGRIEREDADRLLLRPAAASEAPVEIRKAVIRRRERLDLSNMPAGVVNVLEKEQILDLLAYLISDGDPGARVFE